MSLLKKRLKKMRNTCAQENILLINLTTFLAINLTVLFHFTDDFFINDNSEKPQSLKRKRSLSETEDDKPQKRKKNG